MKKNTNKYQVSTGIVNTFQRCYESQRKDLIQIVFCYACLLVIGCLIDGFKGKLSVLNEHGSINSVNTFFRDF